MAEDRYKPVEFGPRISGEEYDRRLVALHVEAADRGGDESSVRRQEFDLSIDHLLGVEFPAQRRVELWDAREAFDRSRKINVLKAIFSWPRRGVPDRLTAELVKSLSAALDEHELSAFLDLDLDSIRRMRG